MEIIESQLNPRDEQFQRNYEYNKTLANELHERLKNGSQGGSAKSHKRHNEQGKMFVRDRIDHLLDSGSPFLELSPLAAYEVYDCRQRCDGERRHLLSADRQKTLACANDC